jgi:hypothetical protein
MVVVGVAALPARVFFLCSSAFLFSLPALTPQLRRSVVVLTILRKLTFMGGCTVNVKLYIAGASNQPPTTLSWVAIEG